jgi:hypothetical protein
VHPQRTSPPPESARYFAIKVVDEQTGRGVPMVELQPTNSARYYTDANALVAIYEPGLMGKKVSFGISVLDAARSADMAA